MSPVQKEILSALQQAFLTGYDVGRGQGILIGVAAAFAVHGIVTGLFRTYTLYKEWKKK